MYLSNDFMYWNIKGGSPFVVLSLSHICLCLQCDGILVSLRLDTYVHYENMCVMQKILHGSKVHGRMLE